MSSQEHTQGRSVGVVLPTRNCAPLLSEHLDQHNEASHCRVVFDPGRYHPLKVRRFVGRLVQFLERASANPEVPMVDLLRRVSGRKWWSRFMR